MLIKLKIGSLISTVIFFVIIVLTQDPDSKIGGVFRTLNLVSYIIFIISALVLATVLYKELRAKKILRKAVVRDGIWDENELKVTARGMFYKIQYALAEFDMTNLKDYLTTEFLLMFTSEVQKLRATNRKIEVDSIDITETRIVCSRDFLNNDKDRFVAYIKGNLTLDSKSKGFEEMYHFIRNDNDWLLNKINGYIRLIDILFEESFIEKEKR